jgi:hypothetical protein
MEMNYDPISGESFPNDRRPDGTDAKGYDYWLRFYQSQGLNFDDATELVNKMINPLGYEDPMKNHFLRDTEGENNFQYFEDPNIFDLYTGNLDSVNIRKYRPDINLNARKPFGYGLPQDVMNEFGQGGPMVSNVPQPFSGPSAQNRGGMMIKYAMGGMMQQSGQQDQIMQMMQQVQEMLMQGANPQELLKQLMKSGLPQDQAQQLVQAAMQDLQSQQQSQQTQMAMGGKMYYNGGPPYDLPGMADMDASEYSNINNYLTNLDTPNVVDNQGNTTSILDRQKNINLNTPNPINNFLNTARSYLSSRDYLKQRGFRIGNKNTNSMTQNQQPIVDPKDYPTIFTQGDSGLLSGPEEQNNLTGSMLSLSKNNTYTGPGTGTPKIIYAPQNPNQYTTTGQNTFDLTDPFASQNTKEIELPNSNSFTQGTFPIDIQNIIKNKNYNNNNLNEKEPWYEEPLYSKIARYAPLGASAAGVITALKNKKRSLTPEDTLSSKINLERSRITTAEEGRRGLDTALRTVRGGAGSSGQLNAATRDLVLTGNKNIAANINKLYETEENTNAQLAQQAALANQKYGNEFKITNEEMFQNAQSQAIKAAQEGAMALQSGAEQERKQYLQEWIAKNRLKTRNMITGPDGKDYYYNPATGKFNSIDTGEQFDSLT